jgi:hypothetical protein
MSGKFKLARISILMGAFLTLVDCAPTFTNSFVEDGKSVVLVGIQTTADYDSGLRGTSHAGIYGLAPHLFYGEKKSV